MCYSVYLSTTSPEDLSVRESSRLRFERDLGGEHAEALELLAFPYRWFLTREFGGCSCHFRTLSMPGKEPSFEPVQSWEHCDADDVEATLEAYEFFRSLVESGHRLDVMCLFSGAEAGEVVAVDVDFAALEPDALHFVENFRLLALPNGDSG